MHNYLYWLMLTLVCILIQSFYSMLEMASLSFNKIRLHYYVSKRMKRAIWLNQLLQNPTRLFGTTLIGVNIALQIGSECSRRFYAALNINPDIAPLSQVFLVLIFAEITPLFAARKYSENVVMLGIPIIYFSSKIFAPITWAIDFMIKGLNLIMRKNSTKQTHLSRDEIKKAIEEIEPSQAITSSTSEETLIDNIFSFEQKSVKDLMIPLHQVQMIPSFYTVKQLKQSLSKSYHPHLPVYQNHRNNIIGIAVNRDFISFDDNARISDCIRPPWFVTVDAKSHHILKQFRHNNQKLAIVLDLLGQPVGIITLEDIVKELFPLPSEEISAKLTTSQPLIDKTFPADMLVKTFNQNYHANLKHKEDETLGDLFAHALGKPPEIGDTVIIDRFEITCENLTLGIPKSLSIKSLVQ